MSKLVWGTVEDRMFETGVDRGVLFVQGYDAAPWNGLISVSESPTGGDTTPYYLDGVKYLNHSALEEFAGTIEAFSSPAAFAECDGTYSIHNGLFASNQKRKPFDFSYRTLIGDPLEGTDRGYKIHLIYNALASPASRSQKTVGSDVAPGTLSWGITTTPVIFPGVRPTSHLVIDSTKTNPLVLTYLEYILYGGDATMARMPTPSELMALFGWEAPGVDFPVHPKGGLDGAEAFLTNLATNPSFEHVVPGTDIVRRNLFSDPRGAGTTAWEGHAGVMDRSPGSPLGLSETSQKFTRLAEGSARMGIKFGAAMPTSGVVSVRMRVRSSEAISPIVVALRPAVGSTSGQAVITSSASIPAGESVLIFTGPVPQGAPTASAGLAFSTATGSVGSTFEITEVLIEQAAANGPYFDGDTSDENGFVYEWEGTPNASSSVVKASTVEVRRNMVPHPNLELATSGWGYSGVARTAEAGVGIRARVTGPISSASQVVYLGSASESAIPVVEGDEIRSVFRVTVPESAPRPIPLRPRLRIARGELPTQWMTGQAVWLAPGETFEFVYSTTADSGAVTVIPAVMGAGEQPLDDGDVFVVHNGWTVEVNPTSPPALIMPGLPSPDPDLTPLWVGVENESGSILSGVALADLNETASSQIGSVYQINDGDTKAARFELITNNGIGIPATGISIDDSVHTLLLQARANDRDQLVTPRVRSTQGGHVTLPQGEWVTIRVTASGSGSQNQTGLLLQQSSSQQAGDSIDIRLVTLIKGEYDGPYFDGDHAPNYARQITRTTWRDIPNQSASDMHYYPVLADTPARVGDAYVLDDNIWVYTPEQLWQNYGGPPVI